MDVPDRFLGPIQKKKVNCGKVSRFTTHGGTIFVHREALCWARIIPTSQWVGIGPQSLLHLVAEESRKFPEGKCESSCGVRNPDGVDFHTDP